MWTVRHRSQPLIALALAVSAFVLTEAQRPPSPSANYHAWSVYGGGPEQLRYSSLTQINRNNVKQLEVAWTYDSGESGDLQTQPIIVDGVLYGYTPAQKVFALDAGSGKALWTFDAKLQGRGPIRGLMFWAGDRNNEARLLAPAHEYIYALNPRTGVPIATFGDGGRIDLRDNLGRDPKGQSVRLTTPGVIFKDLMIVGGRVNEGLPGSPGHIRAYDVRTGALRWTFHTIPHPGEVGYETWSKDSWTYSAGANSWPGMALDERRGIVFVPTGSAAADFYGANRLGDNLFANTLLALNAETGKRIWHFQIVRHDILDRDLPTPPNLVTVRQNGRVIDAVAQATKHGYVFLFDRANGKPLFPIEQRKFPASDVPGEVAAATQPIPTLPKPFARQVLTRDMLTSRTPEAQKWAQEEFDEVPQQRAVRAADRRAADLRLPRLRWRRRMGRLGVRPDHRPPLHQRERHRVERVAGARRRGTERAELVPAGLRELPSRRSGRRSAADSLAHRDRRAQIAARAHGRHPEGRGPHACLPQPAAVRGQRDRAVPGDR